MKNVSGTQGDDKVTLAAGEIFVSGPGNDDVIGVVGAGYAFWGAPGRVDIDLIKGVALDGYGGVDRVQGVTELHLPSTGARVVGSNADENVFSFGGPSWIDLGDGFDTVVMYQLSSTNYAIRRKKDSVTLVSRDHTIELKNVETLQFTDREFNFFAKGNGPYFEYQYEVYAFEENQISDGWWYQGVYNPPQLVSYFPQAVQPFDIDSDLDGDIVVPLNRGYRTGVDTRYNFLVLENESGQLKFNKALTDATPFIAGARRTETIFIERYGSNAFVSVAHDTAIETETRYDLPWRYGDIAIMLAKPFKNITDELVPERTLPKSLLTGRNTAVDAHSLAIGDLNGDGMEDILVGELGVSVFALLQTKEGRFAFRADSFLESLASTWKEPTIANSAPGVLIDLHLTDLNGDGFDDLVVGWGHAIGLSRVFFNDGKGGFSALRSVALPESIYGANNDLHMKTFSEDFDKDGDTDLVILHTRYDPFYGGNYLQFVENTGREKFVDSTISRFGDPQAVNDSLLPRLQWTDFWQAIDLNNDGSLDIVGHEVASGTAFALMNNGRGYFVRELIPSAGKPIVWADFDDDKLFEIVTFSSRSIDSDGTRSTNTFAVYEMRMGTEIIERAFDLDGNAGNAARALATVFGKDALKKPIYAGMVIDLFDQGYTKDQVSQVLLDAVLGPKPQGANVVSLLEKNLTDKINSSGTAAELSRLFDSFNAGTITAAQLVSNAASLELASQVADLASLSKTGWDYIPMKTKPHSSYADLPDTLYQFFVVGFGAAPGVTYMDQMADAYRYWLPEYKDGTVKQIVEAFTTKTQFTNVYPQALYRMEGGKYYAYAHDQTQAGNPLVRGNEVTKAAFDAQMASLAKGLVETIVKTSASEATKTAAATDVQAALGLGGDWTIGKVIYTVFGNLATKPVTDPVWGGTAKQFANQVAVAKYYTDTLSQSTDDVATLRSVMAAVTNTTDVSSNDAIASLIGVALLNGPGI